MTAARLPLALDGGGLTLPEEGRIAVLAPREGADLSALPMPRVQVITGFRPDFDHFKTLGYDCAVTPEGDFAAVLVCMTRAKAEARALVAQAVTLTDGPVVLDGQKDDGIDSMLKECRKRATVTGPVNKAHGKLFWFSAHDDGCAFADWAGRPGEVAGGYVTAPGVFSADGIDPASAMLVEALQGAKLKGRVADLGAGWGYLSAELLKAHEAVSALELVEADHAALDCARRNVRDARAGFAWADARGWRPAEPLDAVVMNPPFHTARSADPELGRAFIRAAAGAVKPSGRLFLVANRHLGYETTMTELFRNVREIAGNGSFKVLTGEGPRRQTGRKPGR